MTTKQALKNDLSDPDLARPILKEIEEIAGNLTKRVQIMEVCGTHTVALRRAGIHSLLPRNVVLLPLYRRCMCRPTILPTRPRPLRSRIWTMLSCLTGGLSRWASTLRSTH